MFETEQICPYTGLRSFTEEESLYFKGREEHIDQATAQLERNKFLMLTGASGDGKSSLIYAGIIPNARAGFLKSKYTQWCVADFRPERTPFQNLCKAVSRQLDITNLNSVQAELNHGFSALIDLYKNSKRYIDTRSVAWQSTSDAEKAVLKREAGNLIILVDQFEEFFTNPENYHKGVPSRDSNLVINLLLEMARISLEEDLPIYVVFTMRSDYIGQCAAFRGLPEYIGFSQFFVPRLNRSQLQQVIEEPAVLSGNRITRRLTERLIHDITEGVDQLPILQHALNQVWHAADSGNEEMDLIHYAMVGGMPVKELPQEQVDRFNKWFERLPPTVRDFYHKSDLQNVLDTHTNKLYEQASTYYRSKTGNDIPEEDAKAIIKNAFICLTKIDQSRAVRNRMTLKEITDIFGNPKYGITGVGQVLNIFREPGNTFIRPFILDDPESQVLDEDTILDITHESLIRNWKYLGQWAKEEFDNYTISLDFEQQLNRWVASGKTKAFLLSIGPLTYFENWFNTSKPNAYWIARYLPEEMEQDKKLSKAKQVLGNMQEFLARSASRHVVTRTFMRYGAKRIAIALALIAVIVLSSFAINDYIQRQNNSVLKSIKEQSFQIANRPKLSLMYAVPVLTEEIKLGNITIPEAIDAVKDPLQKIRIITAIATQLVTQGRNQPRKEIMESLSLAGSLMQHLTFPAGGEDISDGLKLIHDYEVTVGFAYYFSQDDSLKNLVMENSKMAATWAMQVFEKQPADFNDIQSLSLALENGLNHAAFTKDQVNNILEILSPFENRERTAWVINNYAHEKKLVRGFLDYGIPFNGLYQDLSYLYAATGRTNRVLQCVDSLLAYPDNFYQNDYTNYAENATNIAPIYYIYGTTASLDEFVTGYCSRKKISPEEFYNRLVSRAMMEISVRASTNFYAGGGGRSTLNLNLEFSGDNLLAFFFSKLQAEAAKLKDPGERNLNLAVYLKNEGILFAYRNEIRGKNKLATDSLFKEAIKDYQQVPKAYLNQTISVVGSAGADFLALPRKFLFLYPDYRVPFHPFEPRSILQFYNSPSFIQYLLNNDLFDTVYDSNDEFHYFETWQLDYQIYMSFKNFLMCDPIADSTLVQLTAKMEARKANQSADLNILYLHLSDDAFNNGNASDGIKYLEQIQTDKLLNAFQYKNYDFVNEYSLEIVGTAIANLSLNNRFDLAYKLLNVFKKEVNRSSLYGYASQLISLHQQSPEIALRLLDSSRAEMNRLENPALFQPNRCQVAMALMYIDPEKNKDEAYSIIKNSTDKYNAIQFFSKAFAFKGNLYGAEQQLPALVATGDKALFLYEIMTGYNLTKQEKASWKKFDADEFLFSRRYLPYIAEN
jgi:energy-coupling factor transporter ATP-binding protein EcfA2